MHESPMTNFSNYFSQIIFLINNFRNAHRKLNLPYNLIY